MITKITEKETAELRHTATEFHAVENAISEICTLAIELDIAWAEIETMYAAQESRREKTIHQIDALLDALLEEA